MAKKKPESATDELNELFAAPPKEFTARRNELAKKLKEAKRDAEARQVKALKKPPTAAYLVNLVAHRYPADVKAMLDAGDAVEKAQRKGETAKLHEHGAEHRALISSLLERAEAIAGEVGVGFPLALKSKVETAFRVASTNDEDRQAVETGTLTRELQATGFDALFAGGGIQAPKPEPANARAAKTVDTRALKAAEKELLRAKKAQASVEARARKVQQELAAATTMLEKAQAKVAALTARDDD